jgi:hypothetical protein
MERMERMERLERLKRLERLGAGYSTTICWFWGAGVPFTYIKARILKYKKRRNRGKK